MSPVKLLGKEMSRHGSHGRIWFRQLSNLLVSLHAALVIGCSPDEPQPIPAAPSIPSTSELNRPAEKSSNPNTAVLEWDADNDPRVHGYRVYYGPAKGEYLQLRGRGINVGNVTTYTVTGLASGRRYYFAVTAYDTQYNESNYSNEVFKDIP